jgi:predicted PurR-regulated permease PerM
LEICAAIGVALAVGYALVRVHAVIVAFLMALIVASSVGPVVVWLQRRSFGSRRVSRPFAALLVVIGLVIVLVCLGMLVWMPASAQVAAFLNDANAHLYQVRLRWDRIQREFPWMPDLRGIVDRLLAYIKEKSRIGSPEMARLGLQALQTAGGILSVLVMTYYLLLYPIRFDKALARLLPHARPSRLRVACERVRRGFQQWVKAQLVIAGAVGGASFAVYLALGVPYPHLLGVVAALGEFVPAVGPTLAAVVAFGVAMFQSPWHAAEVGIAALLIQGIEGYVLVPRVMHHVVGIPPLLTILALLAGLELIGPGGALLTLPVVAALQILARELNLAVSRPVKRPPIQQPR